MNSGRAAKPALPRPSLLTLPADRRGRGAGAEAIELAASAGLFLDEWQQFVLSESLAEQRNGKWSASEVGVVVPRQNGKGSILEARQLAGLFLLDERLAVHSAHEFKTCFEHFLRVCHLIENTPDLDRLVLRIRRGSGEQAIELRSGQRLRFLARSGGSGRGLSAPTVYLDEAFALVPSEMGALLYAISAQANPQLWLTSSAPKRTSTVLASLLKRGQAGNEPRLLLAMWHAARDGSRWDQARWSEANPGFPHRISPDTIATELRNAGDDPDMLAEFDRERLGIPELGDDALAVIPLDLWNSLEQQWTMTSPAALVLDVAPDGRGAAIVAAEADPDGIAHVEVVDRRPGTDWVLQRTVTAARAVGDVVWVVASSPAAARRKDLEAAGVRVEEMPMAQFARACQAMVDRCEERRVAHRGGDTIRASIVGAEKKASGDVWTWSRASSVADISSLVAATVAVDVALGAAVGPLMAFT